MTVFGNVYRLYTVNKRFRLEADLIFETGEADTAAAGRPVGELLGKYENRASRQAGKQW